MGQVRGVAALASAWPFARGSLARQHKQANGLGSGTAYGEQLMMTTYKTTRTSTYTHPKNIRVKRTEEATTPEISRGPARRKQFTYSSGPSIVPGE